MTALSTEQGVLGDDALGEELPALLGLATALTGTPTGSSDLVAAALVRRPDLVRRALANDFPGPRLQALLVQQFLSRKIRPTGTGLAALSPRARAAVVLRDGYHLTALEIAVVMDRPASVVIADLDALPDSYAGEVAALTAQAPEPGSLADRLGRATRANRRRHARLFLVGVLIAVVVGGLVAVPTVILPRLPAPTRTAGEWRFSHAVKPEAGWIVVLQSVSATVETTEIKPPVPAGDPYSCWVNVYVPGAFKPEEQKVTETTTVHGRRALYAVDKDDDGFLAWEYGTNAWAKTYCSTIEPNSEQLRGIADMVSFHAEPIQVPFTLAALPAGYTIIGLTSYPDSHLVEMQLAKTSIQPGDVNLVISGPLPPFGDLGEKVDLGGRTWNYVSGERMCTTANAELLLCVSGYWPGGDWPAPAPNPRNAPRQMSSLVDQLSISPDFTDPGSWPTGDQLPRR